MLRSQCAVRAYGALCAECGPAGKAYSMASSPEAPPWAWDGHMSLVQGATTRRTVETFGEMFGLGGLKQDNDGQWKGAAHKLHLRASDVKRVIDEGYDVQALHETLSWHAWNKQMRLLPSATIEHAADGPCHACELYCAEAYEALAPKTGGKRGRPAKKARASPKAKPPAGESRDPCCTPRMQNIFVTIRVVLFVQNILFFSFFAH